MAVGHWMLLGIEKWGHQRTRIHTLRLQIPTPRILVRQRGLHHHEPRIHMLRPQLGTHLLGRQIHTLTGDKHQHGMPVPERRILIKVLVVQHQDGRHGEQQEVLRQHEAGVVTMVGQHLDGVGEQTLHGYVTSAFILCISYVS